MEFSSKNTPLRTNSFSSPLNPNTGGKSTTAWSSPRPSIKKVESDQLSFNFTPSMEEQKSSFSLTGYSEPPVVIDLSSQSPRASVSKGFQGSNLSINPTFLPQEDEHGNPLAKSMDTLTSKLKKANVMYDFQSKTNVRKSNLWEPPVSCQRRYLPVSHYQQYFPLEITSRDYFQRLISLLVTTFEFIDIAKVQKHQKPSSTEPDISPNHDKVMNLLLANVSSRTTYEFTNKLHTFLASSSSRMNEQLLKLVTTLLEVKDTLLDRSQHRRLLYDDNHLTDHLLSAFDTTHAFIILVQEYLTFPKVQGPRIAIDTMLLELKDLQNQFKVHQVYHTEKIASLGWKHSIATNNEAISERIIVENEFSQSIFPSLEATEKEKDTTGDDPFATLSYETIMNEAETLQTKVTKIIMNSQEVSLITLIIRIFTMIEDLTTLSNEVGAIGNYQEAHRLRELSSAIDLSINSNYSRLPGGNTIGEEEDEDEEAAMIYFDFRNYLDELYLLKNQVYHHLLQMSQLFSQEQRLHHFPAMATIETSIEQLTRDYESFLYVTRKVSLLQQPSVVIQIQAEGTIFITANYLLLAEYEDEKINIASLLIRSQSEYLLRAIETWPGLTVLNRSSCNKDLLQTALQSLENGGGGGELFWDDQRSQYQSLTDASSYGGVNSSSGGAVMRRNSKLGVKGGALEEGGGFTSSWVLSNTSQYKKEFSQLIFETLQSFEQLVQQLNVLLTTEAMAHTELICRLIGIRDDLYSLIEVNTHATNQFEAERLLDFVTILDNTIDADEQDHLFHHPFMQGRHLLLSSAAAVSTIGGGLDTVTSQVSNEFGRYLTAIANHEIGRGRKRIDNIYHFLQVISNALQELTKLRSRAQSIHDFIAMKSLEQIYQLLTKKMEQLERIIIPFHLLDHENDISSFGGVEGGGSGGVGHPHQPKINQQQILDINERIAREGTEFLTADFLFCYCCGPKGHSIGSLAIVAGAGAILRYIRSYWPAFTILAGGDAHHPSDSPSNRQHNTQMINNTNTDYHETGNPHTEELSILSIDFRNANTLRLLGFDAKTLQLSGFSTIDILTAGFTAEQLKQTGFGIELIRTIPYLDHFFTKAVGYPLETQGKILLEFFLATNQTSQNTAGGGIGGWKKRDGWKELERCIQQLTASQGSYLQTMGMESPLTSTKKGGGGLTSPNKRIHGNTMMITSTRDNLNQVQQIQSIPQLQAILLTIMKKLFGVVMKDPVMDPTMTGNGGTGGGGGAAGGGNHTPMNGPSANQSQTTGFSQLRSSNDSVKAGFSASSSINPGGTGYSGSGVGGSSNHHTSGETSEVLKLMLPQNALKGVIPNSLGSLIGLVNITLSYNQLQGEIPASLGLLIHLEILCLDHNQFEGEIPKTFKNLSKLQILKLESNRLTGNLPPSLGNLVKLKRLDVSQNQLTGPLPQRYGQSFTRLQELLLGENQFTGEIPVSWTNLTQLTHLELQRNQLSGNLPLSFQRLTKLTGLNLSQNKNLIVDRLALQRALPKCRIKL